MTTRLSVKDSASEQREPDRRREALLDDPTRLGQQKHWLSLRKSQAHSGLKAFQQLVSNAAIEVAKQLLPFIGPLVAHLIAERIG